MTVRRYNMNDVPAQVSGVTPPGPVFGDLRLKGQKSNGSPQNGNAISNGSNQKGSGEPGPGPKVMSDYTVTELRKIKSSLDSIEQQFNTDEAAVANLTGQVFRFWTFATGSDVAVAGGPISVGYPANQTITKLRGDTSLFVALQMAFTPTVADNTNHLLVNIDGVTIALGGVVARNGAISQVDLFAIADSHFLPAVLTAGNHIVNVQLGTSANNTTFFLSSANLWVWEELMPVVIFQ